MRMQIVENCHCTGCDKRYAGPPGKYPDEISIRRCEDCHETSENGMYEIKMKWRVRRDGTREKMKAVTYY